MTLFSFILLFLCLVASPITADQNQEACKPDFVQCAPVGASRRGVPVIGPNLARFYDELVYTVQGISDVGNSGGSHKPQVIRRQEIEGDSLCCAEAAVCSLIRSFRIAFCWDRFTTSYFLPDGSYGSASNGSYTTPAGDTANLISGEYHMHDGTGGNIYDESPADKPDPSDLPIPTPWTSSGVGQAIPASQLGAQDTTMSSSLATTTETTTALTSSTVQSTESTVSTAPEQPSSTASISHESTSFTSSSALTSTNALSEGSAMTSMPTSTTTTSTSSVGTSGDTTSSALGSIAMTGAPGASGTSVNTSSPIIPPITNLAAATVVYCMAAKVLLWAATAVMMA